MSRVKVAPQPSPPSTDIIFISLVLDEELRCLLKQDEHSRRGSEQGATLCEPLSHWIEQPRIRDASEFQIPHVCPSPPDRIRGSTFSAWEVSWRRVGTSVGIRATSPTGYQAHSCMVAGRYGVRFIHARATAKRGDVGKVERERKRDIDAGG
jgi:hypothetical protein